jgi:hypothetical protein
MKRIFFLLALFVCVYGYAQPPVNRGSGSITVVDSRIRAALNFGIPIYADTTAANLAVGLDSLGAQIYSRADTSFYGRKVNSSGTKYWASLGGGSTLVEDIGIVISGNDIRTNTPAFKTVAAMRQVPASRLDTGTIYWRNTSNVLIPYKWDDTATGTDDSVTVIQRTGTPTGRFKLYFENYINVDWFGAMSGDGTDDSYPIQKAINFAIANSKSPEVRFSGGNYIVNNVVVYDPGSGGNYDFVTASLKGSNFLTGNATSFTCTDTAGFAIAVQLSRNVLIESITFIGQGPQPSDFEDVVTWSDAQWVDGVRANIYSPHTAINIDPFSYYMSAGNQYTNSASFYTNTSAGGSSQVTIRNCSFKYFVVAIAANISVNVQNGDNIIATGCYFEKNKVAWAAGQTQSRDNVLEKSYLLYNQFITNGADFGQQVGTLPVVSQCNIAGGSKYLYSINSNFAGTSFNQVRAESIWSLGKSLLMSVNFTDCEITMSIPGTDGAFAAPLLAEGSHLNFKGGTLEWFDNTYVAAFVFSVDNLSFDGVSLRGLPYNVRSSSAEQNYINKFTMQNVRVFSSGSAVWGANVFRSAAYDEYNNQSVFPGTKIVENNPYGFLAYYNTYTFESPKIETLLLESHTINIDSSNNTAYFIATSVGSFQVNDLLTQRTNVTYANDIYTDLPTMIGWVYEISGDTVKLKYVPYGLDEATTYGIYLTRIPQFVARTFGTTSSSSNTITGLTNSTAGTFAVGSLIKGTGIPNGTRVTAKTLTTLTLSRNATASGSVELYDAVYRGEGWSDDPLDAAGRLGWTIGDRIYNTRTYAPNNAIAYWVCTTAGFTDGFGTPVSQWTPVYHTDPTKANIASPTFTGTVTTPAITITGGTPAGGKVWTATDGTGAGSWQDAAGGSAYFRNGRSDYDTLFAEIGTDSFVIKSIDLSATTSSIITTTTTDTTVAYAFQLAAATFTATLTNGSNVATSTVRAGRYSRIGDVVTGSLQITIETTGAGATILDFSLPVASAFSDRYGLAGNGNDASIGGSVYANATDDRATLSFSASGAGTTTWTITFTYTVFAP